MDWVYHVLDVVFPFEWMQFTFMKNAFLAILLITPLLALMGTMAVNQRMAFFSDALGHSALTGVGLGIIFGLRNDLVAMLIFGIVWALLISRISQSGTASADTIISVFSSTGIALGVVILSRGGGFAKYSSLLIGDVLAVKKDDIMVLFIALVGVVVLWMLLYNKLLLVSISSALAKSRGVCTALYQHVFAVLIAICVMLAIRWVGVMLINALLILPAAAGRNLARSSRGHAGFSVLIGMVSGVAGLVAAYYFDASAGAAIVLVAAGIYVISLWGREMRLKRK